MKNTVRLESLENGDYVKNITKDQHNLLEMIDKDIISDFIKEDHETTFYYAHSYVFDAERMLILHAHKSKCVKELSFEEFFARAVFTFSKQTTKKTKYLFNN